MVSSWREMPSCLAHQKFSTYIPTHHIPSCVSGLLASFQSMKNFYGEGLLKLQTESSHQPRTLLKITLLHRFLSFKMKLIVPNRAIHYTSFDKTWVSILYPKVIPKLRIQWHIDAISSFPPMLLLRKIYYLLVQDI